MNRLQKRLMFGCQRLRILKFRYLFSDCKRVEGRPTLFQPVQFLGRGTIRFTGTAYLGIFPSPFFLNGYIYLEARSPESVIEFGDGVWINNNTYMASDGPGIFIGSRSMLGVNCEILDTDFHNTHPDKRMDASAAPNKGKVVIGENVMIGSNVKILKGVRIGNNSIIANGSVVTRSVPENMLAFGNPVKCGPLLDPDQWARAKAAATQPAGA
jgi:acetyltransferase-like isoleucine patch superfamily enzyme